MASPTLVGGAQYTNVVTLTMFFQHKDRGWSEKYPMVVNGSNPGPTISRAAVLTAAKDGVVRRAHLLGLGGSIIWARLTDSQSHLKKSAVSVISGPQAAVALTSESPIEKINEISDGLLFRFETGIGFTSNRIFRGMRDSWITDQDVVASLVPATPIDLNAAAMVAANNVAHAKDAALADWLLWIGQNCVNVKKLALNLYFYQVYGTVAYRNVTGHNTGGVFGRHRGRASARV